MKSEFPSPSLQAFVCEKVEEAGEGGRNIWAQNCVISGCLEPECDTVGFDSSLHTSKSLPFPALTPPPPLKDDSSWITMNGDGEVSGPQEEGRWGIEVGRRLMGRWEEWG